MKNRTTLTGIGLAVLATFIWSGNFIVARKIIKNIPPVTLSFYRWLTASLIILPFAWKYLRTESGTIKKHLPYFLATGATGVSMFNTFVYIGGHYSEAINLALIGTTSSPIISVILARIFLKEQIGAYKIAGMFVCITGILLLLSKGHLENLLSLSFSKGDLWVLAAAFSFSVYNTLVKKKPAAVHPVSFLFVVFSLGTLVLVPFYMQEYRNEGGFAISLTNMAVILYLGLGASVICFLVWNRAISKLGAGRTALFGNLIPVFSSLEAVLILHETISWIHIVSFALVISGLIIANYRK